MQISFSVFHSREFFFIIKILKLLYVYMRFYLLIILLENKMMKILHNIYLFLFLFNIFF